MASRGGGTSGSGGGGKVPESGGGGAPGAGKGSGRSGQRTNTHFPELGAVPGRMWRTAAGVEVVLGGGVAYEIQRELEANHFGRTVIAARAVRGPDGRFAASNDPNDLCCLKFTCVWCLSAKQSESQARLERLRQAGDSAATCVFENNYSAIAKLRAMQASGAASEHIVRLRAVIELVVQPDQARGEDAAHCPCAHLVAVLQGASGGELWDYCPALPGPLSVRDAMLLFEQVMTGVAHMHAHDFAHHDLSADNVLLQSLTGPPRLRIIDFGSTLRFKRRKAPAADDVGAGGGVGARGESLPQRRPHGLSTKHAWCSPEVQQGRKYYRPDKHDIWSCGQMLFFLLLAPRKALACKTAMNTDRQFKYLYAHGAGRLLGAKGWRPGLDMWVYDLVTDMMAVNYDERPSADEVLRRIRAHGYGAPRPARARTRADVSAGGHAPGTGAGAGAGAGATPGASAGATPAGASGSNAGAGVGEANTHLCGAAAAATGHVPGGDDGVSTAERGASAAPLSDDGASHEVWSHGSNNASCSGSVDMAGADTSSAEAASVVVSTGAVAGDSVLVSGTAHTAAGENDPRVAIATADLLPSWCHSQQVSDASMSPLDPGNSTSTQLSE